jgi:RES domain-containing protein
VIIEPRLLDTIEGFGTERFTGEVYRHVVASRDPLAPSRAGGRWGPPGEFSVLYTALRADIARAELAHLLSQSSNPPSAERRLWRIRIEISGVLDLTDPARLRLLDIDPDDFAAAGAACARAGRAANFLGVKGLLAPSARARGTNAMVLFDNLEPTDRVEALDWTDI